MFKRLNQQRTPQETSRLVHQIQTAKTIRDLPVEARLLIREIGQRRTVNRRTGLTERIMIIKFRGRSLPALRYRTPD